MSLMLRKDLPQRYEGFECDEKPENVEINVLSHNQAEEIASLLKFKEKNAHVQAYRCGTYHSKVTGEALGGFSTYTDLNTGWSWNCYLADHYVLECRMKPSDEFIEYLYMGR